jgi:hypothetical protein
MPATPSCGRTTNAFMLYDLSEYAEGTLKALDVAYWQILLQKDFAHPTEQH